MNLAYIASSVALCLAASSGPAYQVQNDPSLFVADIRNKLFTKEYIQECVSKLDLKANNGLLEFYKNGKTAGLNLEAWSQKTKKGMFDSLQSIIVDESTALTRDLKSSRWDPKKNKYLIVYDESCGAAKPSVRVGKTTKGTAKLYRLGGPLYYTTDTGDKEFVVLSIYSTKCQLSTWTYALIGFVIVAAGSGIAFGILHLVKRQDEDEDDLECKPAEAQE